MGRKPKKDPEIFVEFCQNSRSGSGKKTGVMVRNIVRKRRTVREMADERLTWQLDFICRN
jgi:hypothetical protein